MHPPSEAPARRKQRPLSTRAQSMPLLAGIEEEQEEARPKIGSKRPLELREDEWECSICLQLLLDPCIGRAGGLVLLLDNARCGACLPCASWVGPGEAAGCTAQGGIFLFVCAGSCGHEYCKGCIEHWRRVSALPRCPVCRAPLPSNLGELPYLLCLLHAKCTG